MKTPRPSILTFALGLCAFTGIAHAGLPVGKPMGKPMPTLQPMASRFQAIPLPDQATWSTGDHTHARELATQARGESEPAKQPAIDAWLASHTVAE